MDVRTLVSLVTCASLSACSSSSGPRASDAGRTRDARPSSNDAGDARTDAPKSRDAGADVVGTADAGDASLVPVFTLDAGITWSALYRDYFGTMGVASCAGDGQCHGSTSQPGYEASGYLCPPGNKTACHAGITSFGDGGADIITPDASFSDDLLSHVLCQAGTGGSDDGPEMPLYCPYTFTTVDLQRIGEWVAAGAQDN